MVHIVRPSVKNICVGIEIHHIMLHIQFNKTVADKHYHTKQNNTIFLLFYN